MNSVTVQEIRSDFPNEWLLITDLEHDQFGNFKSGIVVSHSTNQEEVYRKLFFVELEAWDNGLKRSLLVQQMQALPV